MYIIPVLTLKCFHIRVYWIGWAELIADLHRNSPFSEKLRYWNVVTGCTVQYRAIRVHLCLYECICTLLWHLHVQCLPYSNICIVAECFQLPLIHMSRYRIINIIKLVLEQHSLVTKCNDLLTIYLLLWKRNFEVDEPISSAQPIQYTLHTRDTYGKW